MAKNTAKTLNVNVQVTNVKHVEVHDSLKALDKEFKELLKKQNTFAGVCSALWGLRTSKVCNYLPKFCALLDIEESSITSKKVWMDIMKYELAHVHESMKGQMEEDGKFEDVYVIWNKKAVTVELDEDARTSIQEVDGVFIEVNKTVYILDKDKKKTYLPNAREFKGDAWSIASMWKFFIQSESFKKYGVAAAAVVESDGKAIDVAA